MTSTVEKPISSVSVGLFYTLLGYPQLDMDPECYTGQANCTVKYILHIVIRS